MPGKHHSRAVKLAAAFLARQSGTEAAVSAFGVDARSVAAWVAVGDVPDDEWAAIRDVLRARAADMAARGITSGLVQTLTGAGIADRNVRYSTLIARREARREAEVEPVPTNPIHDAIHALRDDQRGLFRDSLHLALRDREPDAPEPAATTDAESDAAMLAVIAEMAALTPEQVAEQSAIVRAELEPAPPLPVTIVEPGSPEGTAMRLAKDVTPGAPEPRPEPEIGKDGVWVEVDQGEPWQWEAWRRYDT